MRYLITGGLGFIGSNFVRYLLENYKEENNLITIVDYMGIGSNINNLKGLEGKYELINADIANKNIMKKLIENIDIIINFAAETHVDRSISNPEPFLHSNLIGVFNILEIIRESKRKNEIKLIHISTDEVYGDLFNSEADENFPLKPSSPYSAAKASADLFILSYNRTYDINAIILRPSNNYGYYQFPEKLIPKTIIKALNDQKIPLYGDGNQERQWTFVIDTCNAIYEISKKSNKYGEIYNVSSNDVVKNIEVVKKILKLLNKDEGLIEFVEDRPGHDKRYKTISEKIKKSINWYPKYNFEKGIELTVRWYVSNEWWWKPLINEKVLNKTPWKVKW
ncbi:dTDP-glucose 4,6-dehydratase [Caldisphaera lagunensis DSM 15908]|uniref:dTDP-glucose 4,6-dehydratase n=1 Tax=Caldisphaera lagunensis (strain DSM 15908 / JCM 11604 / ANMR 0165 / IC-154) TaxID=1056495 RepID=L0AB81_CALLD|nr:dTDP-glucose 4,6-dehydratase [Caldisphaera lagunensis]AFZ70674.1 dTDP-glucose 4,6-dehydratase [Caldisphaera lagunensis DSM 15908]